MKIKILKEQKMPVYTAAVLSPATTILLREKITDLSLNPNLWMDSKKNPFGIEMLNHHMTIHTKPANKIPYIKDILNKEIDLKVIGFGIDSNTGIAAWKIETDIQTKAATPHITALLREGSVKPHLAGDITTWVNIPVFVITARVLEVS